MTEKSSQGCQHYGLLGFVHGLNNTNIKDFSGVSCYVLDSVVENPMMPEHQSLVLYIVVGSSSKNDSKAPKKALGAIFQSEATWLPGNRPKNGSWLPKAA